MNKKLKITPIGGVGQIGSNMTLIELEKSSVVFDCGILFPDNDFFNLNYLIPNFDDLETPDALIITHGHEDHIGAITHFIDQFPETKIFAPLFAKRLIERKLKEYGISKKINSYSKNDQLPFDHFDIYPIRVSHSIPDTYGMLLKCFKQDLSVLFVSDFKIDNGDLIDDKFDFERLEKLSNSSSKKILFADSTNILSSKAKTPTESELYNDLKKEISKTKERVFITTFASNIFRISLILKIAKELNKIVIPVGRSMQSYINIAQEVGFLDKNIPLQSQDSVDLESSKVIFLVSGCQGDFKSALRRIASDSDGSIKLKEGDSFLFSSKAIPGNEKKLSHIYNFISEKNVNIVTEKDALIHASGHPGQDDLLYLYKKFSPDVIVPIHGETLFLRKHIEFINDNFSSAKAIYLKNFHSIQIDSSFDIQTKESFQQLDPKLICGHRIEIDRKDLSQRRKVAESGSLFISLSAKNKNVSITPIGVPLFEEYSDKIKKLIIEEFLLSKSKDPGEDIRILARRFFNAKIGQKPIVHVHIL